MKITLRKMAVVGLAGLAASAAGLAVGAPARAAIANPSLVMSNNQSGSQSTYTYTFTPGLSLTQMLLGFNGVIGIPGGASGLAAANVSVAENTGSGWTTLSNVTTTLNSTTPPNIAGIAVPAADFAGLTAVPQLKVTVTNLTNPTVSLSTTAGGCVADALSTISGLTSAVFTTGTSGSGASFSSTLANLLSDTACLTTTVVPVGTNGVTEQLNVAPVLNVSLPSTADSFSVIPSAAGAAVSMPTDQLTVATNALTYQIEGLISGSASALKYDGNGGYSLPITASTNSCASSSALGTGGQYSTIATPTGLTNGALTGITYCAGNVNLTIPSGSYSATITYLVVPSF